MLCAGVSDACSFRTHTPLYYSLFVIFLGTMEGSKQEMHIFFVRKGLRSVLTKPGECFVSPVQGSSVTCSFFCEKSDGFQECFVVPQSEGLIGGRGCFTKPIPPPNVTNVKK